MCNLKERHACLLWKVCRFFLHSVFCYCYQTCGAKQCLTAHEDTITVAKATIEANIEAESQRVIAGLPPLGYNAEMQIHVALECATFIENADPNAPVGTKCQYKKSD